MAETKESRGLEGVFLIALALLITVVFYRMVAGFVETIFLALLTTTFGTLIAIPISFVAARNLMADVKSSMTATALSVIGWPVGIYIGGVAAKYISNIEAALTELFKLPRPSRR